MIHMAIRVACIPKKGTLSVICINKGITMKNLLWILFAVLIGIFNAIAIAAALLVIAPTISQAGVIAWTFGGFIAGFFITQRKA